MMEDGAVFCNCNKNHLYKFDTLGKLISNEPFQEYNKPTK